jgi:effector-binding domain-containing protein
VSCLDGAPAPNGTVKHGTLPRGRVALPAVELAATTHVGEHGDIEVTYGELGAWVVANMLAVAWPVREHYLVGPATPPDPAAWRSEIGWPIFRVAQR